MKARFYFDYSDYRSYLMTESLRALEPLPISVQWIAVDAYSLRALSCCSPQGQSPLEREYMRREAERFCAREGIEFVWQPEAVRCGTALQAGVWLMSHDAENFEAYSRRVLESMWGLGRTPDASMVREILNAAGIDSDAYFREASERACFQLQDACLQEALSDGVFDVPTVIIGDARVCHFDQARELRRLALIEVLRSIPLEALLNAYARDLLSLPGLEFEQRVSRMVRRSGVRQSVAQSLQGVNVIEHTLSRPKLPRHLPRLPLHGSAAVCPVGGTSLREAFAAASPDAINICTSAGLNYDDASVFDAEYLPDSAPRLFYAMAVRNDAPVLICVRADAGGTRITCLGNDSDIHVESIGGCTVAALSPLASRDICMARRAACLGAHLILRTEHGTRPDSEAFGSAAASWVIEFNPSGTDIIDSEGHRAALGTDTVMIDGSCRMNAAAWPAPAPRTLLLLEKSLIFGDISAGADIELSCLGIDLDVTTANQACSLSQARDYVTMRIADDVIDLIPVSGEQLFAAELIAYRVLCTINRAPRKSLPFFVNYWSELEFEMLDAMRPVFSAVTAAFQIPLVLVVGSQLVEIWLPAPNGPSYRIEKENDCFAVDIKEQVYAGDCLDRLTARLGITARDYVGRLEKIETLSRKST